MAVERHPPPPQLKESFSCGSKIKNFCHQTSYLRDKSICQFGDTMDYSPWSEAEKCQI